jgi:hypothetical protein
MDRFYEESDPMANYNRSRRTYETSAASDDTETEEEQAESEVHD